MHTWNVLFQVGIWGGPNARHFRVSVTCPTAADALVMADNWIATQEQSFRCPDGIHRIPLRREVLFEKPMGEGWEPLPSWIPDTNFLVENAPDVDGVARRIESAMEEMEVRRAAKSP